MVKAQQVMVTNSKTTHIHDQSPRIPELKRAQQKHGNKDKHLAVASKDMPQERLSSSKAPSLVSITQFHRLSRMLFKLNTEMIWREVMRNSQP
jgi:hypothetical protein